MRHDVNRWFAQNTSIGAHWSRDQLAELKNHTTVSVVLPARNEAATVGDIVSAIRAELVEAVPLVDELVVVDSGSTDGTAEVARRAGAQVARQEDILPRLGDVAGKGEALWKSLMLTRGDIIAFVDADLREFDAQVVVGLLGPLLANPELMLVKAVYDRALADRETILPAGGGRVTELVARPMLNLFWPQLAGFVQPLAGEYAGRRTLLERLPFASGYGVEIAMLIDALELVGLPAMAQVDLGGRQHRNSNDAALGRMAAQVLLAIHARMERHDRALVAAVPSTLLTQFGRDGDEYVAQVTDVAVVDRPAMITVQEYRDRLGSMAG